MDGGTGTCTAKPKTGYTFKAWGGDCTGTGTRCTLSNVTAAKSVKATFDTESFCWPCLPNPGGWRSTLP